MVILGWGGMVGEKGGGEGSLFHSAHSGVRRNECPTQLVATTVRSLTLRQSISSHFIRVSFVLSSTVR